MVSVTHNKGWWQSYDWNESGDEWSEPWGNAETQWYGTLLPRIHHYLPAGHILEIACGFGRWTNYLKDQADKLTAVDLAENCIEACKERFADADNCEFVVNDGRSFPTVADKSIDFAFSYDSLVHVDADTISAYLGEIGRVLKSDGVAFIHHSNLGEYGALYRRAMKYPKLLGALRRTGVLEYGHMRDTGVTAEFVAAEAKKHGLVCIGQEVNTWLTRRTLIDCVSVFVPADSPAARPNQVVRNRRFTKEPAYLARVDTVYGPRG